MAVNIIINAGVAIFATGLLSILFMPLLYQLAYENDYWTTAPQAQLIIRDNIYNILLIIPVFLIGAIVLWAYKAATRETQVY